MNRTQKERFALLNRLCGLGFTFEEAQALRRISMTLHRWHELECGTGEGQTSWSIERENGDGTGKPYMRVQYPTRDGYVDRKWRIADRESGALRRLARIVAARNAREASPVTPYVQGDCRGAALYVLREQDMLPGHSLDCIYSRGLAVA